MNEKVRKRLKREGEDMHIYLGNTGEELGVSERGVGRVRVIGFPVKGDLVAETRFHVSIQAVVRDVGETALEPLPTNRNRQTSMEIGFRFANTEHKHGN